jgi:hypothetical protein
MSDGGGCADAHVHCEAVGGENKVEDLACVEDLE